MQVTAAAIAIGGGIVTFAMAAPSAITATGAVLAQSSPSGSPATALPDLHFSPQDLHFPPPTGGASEFILDTALTQLPPLQPRSPLSATVFPQSIQLGETLTVRVQVPTDGLLPVVTMGDRQYPVFSIAAPISSNTTVYRALIPSSPLDSPGPRTITVAAGDLQQSLPVTLRDRQFPTQSITVGSGGLEATQKELDAVSAFKEISSPTRYWDGKFLKPSTGWISAIYGVRRYYNGVFANNYYHRGVDYAAPLGAPIIAPAAGKIALVGREAEGFVIHGNTVGIDHGQGVVSIFLHLNQISVSEGQSVAAGQQIGTIGTSGASTGPHLHWGLYVHGVAVDPVPWRFQGVE